MRAFFKLGLKSAILYAITPQMEDKFTLKAPRRVGEEEFLKYVKEKCGGSTFARRQILDYYAEMKRIDEENGKHLTPESFGSGLRDSYGVNLYTDQARYLFFSEAKQDEDVESHNRFVTACRDASEEEKEMLRRIRENEMKSIFLNPLPPIGYADLFRYQFVNFVDEIVLKKGECERKDVSGSVDTSSNILSIYEHTESNSKRTDYEIFNNILLWRHELTHVMAIKSEYGGQYKTVNPFFITHSKGTIFKADNDFFKNENAEDRRKVASLFFLAEISIVKSCLTETSFTLFSKKWAKSLLIIACWFSAKGDMISPASLTEIFTTLLAGFSYSLQFLIFLLSAE